jgi:hypothetical protein
VERVWVVGAAVRRREVDRERARKLGATFKDKVTFYIQNNKDKLTVYLQNQLTCDIELQLKDNVNRETC